MQSGSQTCNVHFILIIDVGDLGIQFVGITGLKMQARDVVESVTAGSIGHLHVCVDSKLGR